MLVTVVEDVACKYVLTSSIGEEIVTVMIRADVPAMPEAVTEFR